MGLLVALLAAAPAAAQVPRGKPPLPGRPLADTTGQRRDSTASDTGKVGRGAGLPSAPSRSFQTPDSVEAGLLDSLNYRITRYAADSVQFLPGAKEIRMSGQALVAREGSTLQADTINYAEKNCAIHAAGAPQLFDATGVVVGHGMLYDACNHAGLIGTATTDVKEGPGTWYIRGNLAVDNEQNRVYAAGGNITSCDLPDPHYHFAAREVKWVSKSVMVARPAVLYVADVPVLWLPFIFQDMRHGRRSGLIPPSFGLNDIVRNSPTYKRHITNLGWFWVLGDYADLETTVDWYSQQNLSLRGQFQYKWLNRFMTGVVTFQELHEFAGGTSYQIQWGHQQDFSLESHLTANINYASSTSIISRNTVDPVLAVSTINSQVNFQQRFPWGSLSVGGNRTQNLNNAQVSTNFPTVAFTPNPIAVSDNVTWTPSFSVTNALLANGPSTNVAANTFYQRAGVAIDTTVRPTDSRQTQMQISTPLRIGRWNWSNAVTLNDQWSNQRVVDTILDPADTARRLVRTYDQSYETDFDWTTGINLPLLLQGSWNLQPSVNIVNTTSGPFMLRNRFTNGTFVTQGKRLGYSLSIAPTFFGLFPGFGPIARIRHSISPSVSWSYAPAATIPLDYARALANGGPVTTAAGLANGCGAGTLRSCATQTITLGLNQNFEAKLRPPPAPPGSDTSGAAPPEARKIKLLSIQTSAVGVDLEQAKKKGFTGWTTGTLSNTFATDLLSGFSFSTSHSLFDGPAGSPSSHFHPYLTSVSVRFGLGASFLQAIGSFLGMAGAPPVATLAARRDTTHTGPDTLATPMPFPDAYRRDPLAGRSTATNAQTQRGGTALFNASIAFDYSRQRPVDSALAIRTHQPVSFVLPQSTISGSLSFSPTKHWSVSWETLYDIEKGQFASHVLTLNRDLHDWRATFAFVQSPNGNVVFNFNITLIDQPEIKFDYDQRSLPLQ